MRNLGRTCWAVCVIQITNRRSDYRGLFRKWPCRKKRLTKKPAIGAIRKWFCAQWRRGKFLFGRTGKWGEVGYATGNCLWCKPSILYQKLKQKQGSPRGLCGQSRRTPSWKGWKRVISHSRPFRRQGFLLIIGCHCFIGTDDLSSEELRFHRETSFVM